jgi:hypothetical protein
MMARIMSAIWRGETQSVNLLPPDLAKTNSISKKFLESLRHQGGVARRILNVAVPEIGLDRTGVVAIVGELLAASMAQHMGMSFDAQIGRDDCPPDYRLEGGAMLL